ncbi:Flp pilus assembly complex ATPase component TadA [Francisella philomiragia]|uniref:ATPase, T2SS/T4P/T4SS family n=1 Tax=Francisella philomiragia TaxID=28110 RepID=UPI0019072999|nr:ATPase, T2SS/T4P/T4SS family [Francisella philomiragia]MBK2341736.1 Flp pilus assembly complex ATPase component TadA [Francisella philomiragia]
MSEYLNECLKKLDKQERKIVELFDQEVAEQFFVETVTDINLNSNGTVFVTDAIKGKFKVKSFKGSLTPIINFIADFNDLVVNQQAPKLETSFLGMRITGIIPPNTDAAILAIRKPNEKIKPLHSYVTDLSMTENQFNYIHEKWIESDDPINALIAGGTGSGKTTLMKSIINELTSKGDFADRIVSIEDTPELVINVEDKVPLFKTSSVSLANNLESALRLTPKRIFVGEVRDYTVIDMLNCFNTGHNGGLATIHANNCKDTIQRIISLGAKHFDLDELYILIATTVGAIISIQKRGDKRIIDEILEIQGYDRNKKEIIFKSIK